MEKKFLLLWEIFKKEKTLKNDMTKLNKISQILSSKSQLENYIKFQNGHLKSTIRLSYKLLKPGWFYINSTIKLNKLGCLLNLINLKLNHKRPIFYDPGSRTLRKTWPILFVATQLKRSNLCVRLTTNSRYFFHSVKS